MLNRKLEKGKAGLADLCQLYRASSKLPAIAGALSNYEGPHSQLLASRYIDHQLSQAPTTAKLTENICCIIVEAVEIHERS